jgi:hypothetical protein
MKESGKTGMTDTQVIIFCLKCDTCKNTIYNKQIEAFVGSYMPAYEAYLPTLYLEGPQRMENTSVLQVIIKCFIFFKSYDSYYVL